MAKILTGVRPGQVSDVEQEVIASAPVQELKERVPQPQEGGLDSLLAPESAPPAAPIAEEVVEDTRERDVVPTITERSRETVTPTKWDVKGDKPVADTDGGLQARAQNVAAKFTNNNTWEGGLGLSGTTEQGLAATLAKVGAVTDHGKVDRPDGGAGFNTALDPGFLMVGAAVTENVITRLAQGQTAVANFQADKISDEPAPIKNEVTKAQANVEIGQEINREYQRIKAAKEGRPTEDYSDLPADEAALLGDAFKEMYSAANPDDLKRVAADPQAERGQATFQLTPEGLTRLNSPDAIATRAKLFPGVNVRPAKAPIATRGGQLKSEVGRVATRKASGKIKKKPADGTVIEEAMENMATIPNVVDGQRLRILYATALPALRGGQDVLPFMANINLIGEAQVQKFNAEAKKNEREGIAYDPAQAMAGVQFNLAQSIRAAAMERKGANYLSYYAQNFNGRIAPQQSYFDPTTSKTVRFVTRNAVPAKATPGSRIDRNLRQMYAMMLVKGADADLPAGREVALAKAAPKLAAWGKRLQEALDNSMNETTAEAISEAIEAGIPMTDPSFPQFSGLALDPEADADLISAINSKGEDGTHFIDGLIDFAKYHEAQQKGQPYYSYFNAYMDGKTNGIASNGIQMGSRDVAFKTGVMRTNPDRLLDEDTDVRDQLMRGLNEQLDITGLQTDNPNLYTIARAVNSYRQLAKDTTMTFGYGKELESFKQDISDTLDFLVEADPEVAAAVEAALADGDRDSIVETLHTAYVNQLGGALSEEAIEARPLMRAAATLHALMDKVFTIKTATDFDLHLGGEITTGQEGATSTTYDIREEGGGKRKVTSQRFGTRSTAAAAKGDQGPGSRAYGGSLPGPVQSIDAATVALTASGKSWDKLKAASNGNPYMHTIYDAFKVDAMGYDVILEETNKNWLDSGMNWSYLQATLDATNEAVQEFNKDLANYPDSLPILTGPNDEFVMFGHLTAETESQSGKMGPWNLAKMLGKLRDPEGKSGDDFFFENLKMARSMIDYMKEQGFNPDKPTVKDLKVFMKSLAHNVRLQPRLTAMIDKTNRNKEALKKEIKESGVPVYQYYAH